MKHASEFCFLSKVMARFDDLKRSYPLKIKLLGTPSMEWEGRPFLLSRKQARALIYVLATTLHPLPRNQLTYLFWPDTPEDTARRNLSRLTSFIRGELPHPELIQVGNESIGLNTGLVWSDAAHFMELAGQNSLLKQEELAALWDGSFLSGFSLPRNYEFDVWLSTQQQRYESRYLIALKDLIQAKFAVQDFPKAIHYAQKYLNIDELAEDVHRELIQLYAASGDRSASLRQFETCTLILERELGVEPSPETMAAYKNARAGGPGFQPDLEVKSTWTILPSLDLPLIGRKKAFESLNIAYKKFQSGGVIFIKGEPGIGKSRLLKEFVTTRDTTALNGNCHTSTRTLPYHPIAQVLRQALSQRQLWSGIRPIWLAEAGRLLPEMRDYFSDLPLPIQVEPEEAQVRLFEALSQCMLGFTSKGPLIICFDDIQWMDEATFAWMVSFSTRLAGSGLCILATYRIEEEASLTNLRQAFNRIKLLAEISLAGLSEASIRTVLEQLPRPPIHPNELAARIHSTTGGNPFFVLEIIRSLLESDQLIEAPPELPLPNTVHEAIQSRLERLSPTVRQILETAAVVAPDLDYNLLKETSGRSELEASDGLDDLVNHHLLTNGEQYRFRHGLIQQVVYQSLNPWRRQLLHRRAAETYVELNRSRSENVAAQIPRHYDHAGEYEQAAHFYYQAAVLARHIYAYEGAIVYLQNAIRCTSRISLSVDQFAQYYELLGECLVITGQYETAREVYNDCLKRIPTEMYLQRVKFLTHLAGSYASMYLLNQAEETYEKALALLDSHPVNQDLAWQQAWLEIQLERLGLLYTLARAEEMEVICKEIEPVLENAGTPDQRMRYYGNQASIALRRERYMVSEQTLRLGESRFLIEMGTGDLARTASAKFRWGFVLLWSGDLAGAENPLSEALEMAEETGELITKCHCLVYLTTLHRLRGEVKRAQAYAVRAVEIAQQLNSVVYIGAALGNLSWLDWQERAFDRAESQAQEALSAWGNLPYPFKWLAHWVLLAGYLDRDHLERAAASASALLDPTQQRLPDDLTAALVEAVNSWEGGRIDPARKALQKTVDLARRGGYL